MKKLFIVLFKFLGILLSFIVMLLITNYFSKKAYGVFSYYFSLLQVFSVFILYGSEIKIFRIKRKTNLIMETIFYILLRGILLLLLSIYINNYIYIYAILSSIFLSFRIVNSIIIRTLRKLLVYSIVEFVALNLIFLFLIGLHIILGVNLFGFNSLKTLLLFHLLAMFFSFFISFLIIFHYGKRIYIDNLRKNIFNMDIYKFIISFFKDFKILLPSLLWILEENIDIFLIKHLYTYKEVGIYSILFKIGFIIYIPIIVLNNAFLYNFSKKNLLSIRKITIIIGTLIFLGLVMFEKVIFNIFNINDSYNELYMLVLLSFLLPSFFGISYNMAQLKIKDKVISYILIKILLFNLIFVIIFYKILGIYVIPLAKMFALIIMNFLFYRNLKCYL